ncbi:hypothetical protein ACFLSE_07430 [Bacteroidota bacterium]
MKLNLLLLFIIPLFLISCGDDPLSKSELLLNSWILEETTLNGEEYYQEALYFKGGVYSFYADQTLQFVTSQNSNIINGTWQLKESETILSIAFSGVMYDYKIEKINSSSLWMSISNSEGDYFLKYSKVLLE